MKVYADQGVNQRELLKLKKKYNFTVVQARDIE